MEFSGDEHDTLDPVKGGLFVVNDGTHIHICRMKSARKCGRI